MQPEDGVDSGRGAMTFHSLRHTHKTWMAEHHTPASLQDYRMGHCPRGIAGRYEHPTAVMVAELMGELEQRWHTAERTDCPPAGPDAGGIGSRRNPARERPNTGPGSAGTPAQSPGR